MVKQSQWTGKKALLLLTALVALLVLLTILQDSVEATFNTTSFYLSESFLFTSFWWIFVPFLYIQYFLAKNTGLKLPAFVLFTIVPIVLHFIAFPFIVWLLSGLFYENTYRFQQTLRYGLSEHLYIVLFLYTVPVCVFLYIKRTARATTQPEQQRGENTFVSSLLVTEGNRKMMVAVSDIRYFSASSPYVTIYTGTKKYLSNESLKSIGHQLDERLFVRIHKSTIVNIRQVHSYTSRLNGDYDLVLKDGSTLRISRNYIVAFKHVLQEANRVAVQ